MGRLTLPELRARLAFDYEVMERLTGSTLGSVRAYASAEDMRRGRTVTPAQGAAGQAVLYTVELGFPVPVGRGRTARGAVARLDLLAGGNYPFTAPTVQFVGAVIPWAHRVYPANGGVCLGNAWESARGAMLAAQLAVHVMRLVNLDEPPGGDGGTNRDAHDYWQTVLGGRPLHPRLVYPALPADLTHEVECEDEESRFELNAFRPIADVAFIPSRVTTSEDAAFRPLGVT